MKLKFLLSALSFVAVLQTTTAQNVGINSSGTAPNVDAMLDIVSTTKGLLIPRMTSTQRIAIAATPATGLLVYDITLNNFYYFDGSSWVLLATGANSDWKLTGNASTSPSTNFLGTTDAQDLVFKTNNTEKMRILSGGNVGIGTSAPGQLLEVNGGNILAWKYAGNPNIIQRRSNGSVGAEANLVANDVIGYNNFQAYQSSGSWPNVVRVGAEADGAHTSTSLPSRLIFSTTPSGSSTLIERMRISNAGNVGINNNAPTQPLDVTGNVQFSGALMPGGSAGTSGQVLTSAGAGAVPTWGALGQSSTTYFSTGNIQISDNVGFYFIPGFPVTINVPANCKVLISGGIGVNGTGNGSSALSVVAADVAVIVDNAFMPAGLYQRIIVNNTHPTKFQYASFSQAITLTQGSHTIGFGAFGAPTASQPLGTAVANANRFTIGGTSASVFVGELTVTFIKN
ncbi:MAG: hypothetical protein K9H41_04880 [Bacteroidia bacterium]|nr:hypothetical protein [Bacteroidia bacterium]